MECICRALRPARGSGAGCARLSAWERSGRRVCACSRKTSRRARRAGRGWGMSDIAVNKIIELCEKLDASEARVRVLEKQLAEQNDLWAEDELAHHDKLAAAEKRVAELEGP